MQYQHKRERKKTSSDEWIASISIREPWEGVKYYLHIKIRDDDDNTKVFVSCLPYAELQETVV